MGNKETGRSIAVKNFHDVDTHPGDTVYELSTERIIHVLNPSDETISTYLEETPDDKVYLQAQRKDGVIMKEDLTLLYPQKVNPVVGVKDKISDMRKYPRDKNLGDKISRN